MRGVQACGLGQGDKEECIWPQLLKDEKARANARNIVDPNLLRAFPHHVVCCCDLLEIVG